jgi:DNA-binding NtrC family response regulator
MENVIRRAVLYCQKGLLTTNDLPSSIRGAVAPKPGYSNVNLSPNSPSGMTTNLPPNYNGIQPGAPVLHPNVAFKGQAYGGMYNDMHHANSYPNQLYSSAPLNNSFFAGGGRPLPGSNFDMPVPEPQTAVAAAATVSSDGSRTLEARVDVMERRIIEDCLRRNNHRRKETAAELGISRVTLYNKMKKFGLL